MNKKYEREAIRLTQEILCRFWQGDCDLVLSRCTPEVVWIGSEQGQFMRGRDAVEKDLRGVMQELKPCHLFNQEFLCAQNEGDSCTVVGRYLTTTDPEVEYYLQVQQRCTFTWRLAENRLWLSHIHVSNPMGELKTTENGHFVNALGKMAHRYLRAHVKSMTDQRRIPVTDAAGSTCFVALNELLWVSANRKHGILHTLNGELETRESYTELCARLSEDFVSVHRSYTVNVNCIEQIKHYAVVMEGGAEIPIPIKRYETVRTALMKKHEQAAHDRQAGCEADACGDRQGGKPV